MKLFITVSWIRAYDSIELIECSICEKYDKNNIKPSSITCGITIKAYGMKKN